MERAAGRQNIARRSVFLVPIMWNLLVLSYVLAAAVTDLRSRTIPRALTTGAIVVGLAYHGWRGGFGAALLAAFIGFSVGLLLFRMGAFGGGDVKLMAALGALLGLGPWARAMFIAVLIAGAMGVYQAVHQRAVRRTMGNVGELLAWNAAHPGQAHPELNVRNRAMLRAPFGVAAALGTVLTMGAGLWR